MNRRKKQKKERGTYDIHENDLTSFGRWLNR